MSDANSLRALLSRVDGDAPTIQGAAGAMMKHYDRSPGVAVVQWRDALHNSKPSQWLPLLYVANEVLQNSKRNRGNKFLEAFSPVLGQSLIFVCQHSDGAVVEKVRRTVKIWGERRVLSVRFVNEVLKGLEPYRNNRGGSAPPPGQQEPSSPAAGFSPTPAVSTTSSPHQSTLQQQQQQPGVSASSKSHEDSDSDDPMDIFNDDENGGDNADGDGGDDDDESDDDDNMFGNSESAGLKMDGLELTFDSAGAAANNKKQNGTKRRRSSTASTGSQASITKRSRRKSVLSTTSLVELWKQVSALEQAFDHSNSMVKDIRLPTTHELESLVGDELLEHHKTITKYEERVSKERRNLHRIATERKSLEQEAMRFLPWLEAALKQDQDDIDFCKNLEASLLKMKLVHPAIKEARDKRVAEDLRFQREQEEKERKRKEEEESKKFRESALSKETEQKPGMVWNKVTQEYCYANTDESWRD